MTSNLSAELLRNIHLDTPMYTATQVSSLTKIDNNTIIRNLSSELQVSEVIDDSFEKTFELSSQAFPRGITDIYYANGLWVACTNTRGILKSTDGTTWTDTNKTTGHFFSCYYANGLWLTGSDQGGIWKSTDGNTWSQTAKTDDNIRTIIYINGLWLAGDFDGRGIWKSTDGNTWTQTAKNKGHIVSIHYANGLFVAVAGYNEGIWKSTDGNTWSKTSQTAGSFRSVNYACGLWLATSLETGIWTSTDGNTWSNVPNVPRSPQTIYCSCYANGVWLVGTDGFGIYKSTDGKIWSKTSLLLEHVYTVHYNNGMFIVGTMDGIFKSKIHAAYSPSYEAMNDKDSIDTIHTDILKALDTEISARKDADNLLSAAISASTPVRLSADNNTIKIENNIIKTASVVDDKWTQTSKTNGSFNSIYYANGLWLAGSNNNTGIWKSTDGQTWSQTAKTNGYFRSINYANGLWLAGSTGIWKSTDGQTWTQTTKTDGDFRSINYANGLWLAGSNGDIGIWKSTDGNTWTQTAKTDGYFYSLYYANGLWIAGTDSNTSPGIWKSTDGNTWTQTAKTDGYFYSLYYANGLWLAGSNDNTGIWKSTDGNTWTRTAKTDGSFNSIHYANGLWLAGSDRLGIWKSTDGNTWTQTSKTNEDFYSVYYANGMWLASNGTGGVGIWKSNIHASYNPDNKLQVTNNYGSVSQKYIAGQGISISGVTISAIPDALKQDKLTAGSNISIVNNVITANIPPLSGGGSINIDNNTLITNSENKVQVADMINDSWKVVNPTNKNFSKIICNNNVILAGCSDLGGLYRSEDFGESWNIVSADSGSSGVDLLSSITVDSFGYNKAQYIASIYSPQLSDSLGKFSVVASNDSGKTWNKYLDITRASSTKSAPRLISLVHTNDKWLGGGIDGGLCECMDYGYICDWKPRNRLLDEKITEFYMYSLSGGEDIYFVGTQSGGMWKSIDLGDTWYQLSSFGSMYNVSKIRGNDYNTIYSIIESSLYVSKNDGDSWTRITEDSGLSSTSGINLYANSIEYVSGAIYVGTRYGEIFIGDVNFIKTTVPNNVGCINTIVNTDMGLFATCSSGYILKSADSGITWTTVYYDRLQESIEDIAAVGQDLLIAVGKGGSYISSDKGATWKKQTGRTGLRYIKNQNYSGVFLASGDDGLFRYVYDPLISPENIWTSLDRTPHYVKSIHYANGLWLAGSGTQGYGDGIWKSTDGNIWNQTGNTNGNFNSIYYANGLWVAGSYRLGIWKSTDGNTWTQTTKIDGHFRSIHYANGLWLASGGNTDGYGTGIWKSTDGNIWNQTGNTNGNFNSIYYANGLWVAVSCIQGIWKSIDGEIWTQTTKTDGWFQSIHYANGLWLAGSGDVQLDRYNIGIWKSTDGNTWTQTDNTDGGFSSIYYANGLWLAGTSDNTGIWKSTDGNKWSKTTKTDGNFQSIYYANGCWLAGTPDNKGIWKSTDGNTWNNITDTRVLCGSPHYYFGVWYISDMNGGYSTSLDNGATWTKKTFPVYTYKTFYKDTEKDILAGTKTGILKSSDYGTTWGPTSQKSGEYNSIDCWNGLYIAGSTNLGLWYSNNGTTWTQTNKKDGTFSSVKYANGIWLASGLDNVWKSTDGLNWTETNKKRDTSGSVNNDIGHTKSSWFVGTGNSIVQSNIGTFLNKYPVISDILEILKRNNLK